MRSTRQYRTLAAVLAVSCMVLPSAGITRAAGGVLLRAHFVVGATFSSVQDSTTTTKINAVLTTGKQSQKLASSDVEVDHFPIIAKITKVYADGSGLVRLSFGPSSVTNNGKTTKGPMTGYYRLERIAPDFHLISKQIFGAAGIPADLRSALPDTDPIRYPAGPVSVGSTWTISQHIDQFGTMRLHFTLLALGTQNGRQTATTHAEMAQPAQLSTQGLLFKGTLNGSQDSQFFPDLNQDVVPSHSQLLFKGKLSGVASGVTVKGSFSISTKGTSTPQP